MNSTTTSRLFAALALTLASTVLAVGAGAQQDGEPGTCLEELTTIQLEGDAARAYGFGIDPIDGTVYAAVDDEARVDVIDPQTNQVTRSITLPDPPNSAFAPVVDHDARLLYVSRFGAGVAVIDLTDDSLITTIPVVQAQSMALDPTTDRLYVANQQTGVDVIDTTNNTIIDSLAPGVIGLGVALDLEGDRIFVGDFTNSELDIYDSTDNSLIDSVPISDEPITVVYDATTELVWITTRIPGNVLAVDPDTGLIPISFAYAGAQGLAINPAAGQGYVTPQGGAEVRVFSLADGTEIDTFPTGANSLTVAARQDPVRIYVGGFEDGTVTVIGDVPPCPQFATTTTTTTSTTAPPLTPVAARPAAAVALTPTFTG